MLMTLPVSKVSVPLTVRTRIRSSVPEIAVPDEPEELQPTEFTFVKAQFPLETQVLPLIFVKIIDPANVFVEVVIEKIPNPVVITLLVPVPPQNWLV
jgi:hypothetical protein